MGSTMFTYLRQHLFSNKNTNVNSNLFRYNTRKFNYNKDIRINTPKVNLKVAPFGFILSTICTYNKMEFDKHSS